MDFDLGKEIFKCLLTNTCKYHSTLLVLSSNTALLWLVMNEYANKPLWTSCLSWFICRLKVCQVASLQV